jgi:lipoprotein-releasing system permease protein
LNIPLFDPHLNFPFFLARRLSVGRAGFSGLIVRIAIASVALSVAVMIVSVAIVKGYQKQIRAKITGFSADIQISRLDMNNSYETTPIHLDTKMEAEVLALEGVRHMQPVAIKAGIIKTPDEFEGIVLRGVNNQYDFSFIRSHLLSGNVVTLTDSTASKDIVLSQKTASRLRLKVGDAVKMYFIQGQAPPRARRFTLAGIYKTGFDEMDELYAFVDIHHVQKLNNWTGDQVSGYEVLLTDDKLTDRLAPQIVDRTPYHLEVQTIRQRYPQLFDWLGLLDLNAVVIIILMIIVACINMSTALLILIVERSNMVGVLKAIGAGNGSLAGMFLYIASYLILAGLLFGNILGAGLCWTQARYKWLKLSEEAYYLSEVPVELNLMDWLGINIGAFGVCLVVLIIPALFVMRITPVKAIRFE